MYFVDGCEGSATAIVSPLESASYNFDQCVHNVQHNVSLVKIVWPELYQLNWIAIELEFFFFFFHSIKWFLHCSVAIGAKCSCFTFISRLHSRWLSMHTALILTNKFENLIVFFVSVFFLLRILVLLRLGDVPMQSYSYSHINLWICIVEINALTFGSTFNRRRFDLERKCEC